MRLSTAYLTCLYRYFRQHVRAKLCVLHVYALYVIESWIFFSPSSGTYPNRNTGVQGTNSSADSGLGSLDHATGSTTYNNMVSSVTPSQTRNFGNGSARGRGQGRGRGSTGGTGNLQIEATPGGRSILSNHNQVRQQHVGNRMRLGVVLHKQKVICC